MQCSRISYHSSTAVETSFSGRPALSPAIKPEKIRLGKQEYVHDERTLMMARFLLPDLRFSEIWDFDKGRAPFPLRTWNNTRLGDCVVAGEANQLMRLE